MYDPKRLTTTVRASGCAAKVGPGELRGLLSGLTQKIDSNLMVGFDLSDDAAVYRLPADIGGSGGLALVQTLDFFTPIVDDAYNYGRIAAANAISDVYAMGGRPFLALNILCFPVEELPREVAGEVMAGGLERAQAAGVTVAGGHTIDDVELKYGMCVTGLVDPEHVLTNAGARPGQVLILGKPIGAGIIATAVKADLASPEESAAALASMLVLNSAGSHLYKFGVAGATDVTGYGLLGHGLEMARASRVKLVIEAKSVPLLPGVLEKAGLGLCPKGWLSNARYIEAATYMDPSLPEVMKRILADPQTSGGLLAAVPEKE
ncbi:MAG: selenide, water dikinase SelD, partial [Candidatus Adiutrix sp.]|nr:selenide, water dikinase SelD [Candidatus Adiutrix sp.]